MSDYIPPEVIRNILARLPMDSLLRCTTVCKSWYSLITSSSFISSHLKLSSPNQEPRLLIKYSTYGNVAKEHYSVYRDNQTLDEITKLDCQFTNPRDEIHIIDTCNGLVCFSHSYDMKIIFLWNPSLRKSLTLPKPNIIFHSKIRFIIGFGFVPTINDYKIVKISYHDLPSARFPVKFPPEVEIYELSTNSWRTISAGDYSYLIMDYHPQALLNGILHWHAYNPNHKDKFSNLIASFDLKTERLGALMLPNCLSNESLFTISTFKDTICVILVPKDFCSIWVMKTYGVEESWENLFNIDVRKFGVWPARQLYFRESGGILYINKFGILIETESVFNIANSHPLFSYYPDDNIFENNVHTVAKAYDFYVYRYVESLVLINSSDQVFEDNQTGEGSKHEEEQ